ncbi:3'-5' exonuclease [Streptomyces sp. NPDC006430]|uniref:3'-5' exonuclease n=1 Tax=Streptomyces sp. NPDC006430 TaxID=3154299 RepID=UPI0033BE0084
MEDSDQDALRGRQGYRTTREILRDAIRVLGDADYDDLDGDTDTLAGYRSVLHGTEPSLHGARSWDEEMDLVVEQLRARHDVPREAMAICVPTNDMVTQLADRLARSGIAASEITQDGPRGDQGVHVGTMYRFKGLEYRCLIIAGAAEGLVPRTSVDAWEHTDPSRHRRELHRARSLLFVAATRARDALAITWHGEPSRFLAPLIPAS